MQQEARDLAYEAAKGAPAVAGAVSSILTLNEWLMVGTGVYLVLQVLYLLRKWWREESDWLKRKGRRGTK